MASPIPDSALETHMDILIPKQPHIAIAKACIRCGQQFYPRVKYQQQRFCSCRCSLKHTLPPDHNARVARETHEARSDAMRGRGAGKGYIKRGGRHEHRAVAEEKIGRKLRKGEVVHHKDGDKRNNDPSNLQVMTAREHMLEHGLGVPGITPAHEPWRARWNK